MISITPDKERKPFLWFWITIITARKRSLGQCNIFRSVCQEFCLQGDAWSRGVPGLGGVPGPGGGVWSWGVSRPTTKGEVEEDLVQVHNQGGSWGGSGPGPHPRGEVGGNWRGTPPMATAAGGAHPTGMHSCFVNNKCRWRFFWLKSFNIIGSEQDINGIFIFVYKQTIHQSIKHDKRSIKTSHTCYMFCTTVLVSINCEYSFMVL